MNTIDPGPKSLMEIQPVRHLTHTCLSFLLRLMNTIDPGPKLPFRRFKPNNLRGARTTPILTDAPDSKWVVLNFIKSPTALHRLYTSTLLIASQSMHPTDFFTKGA